MHPLPAGALVLAGREQDARALISAVPGMMPEDVGKTRALLKLVEQQGAQRRRRSKAVLGASTLAVVAGVLVGLVG